MNRFVRLLVPSLILSILLAGILTLPALGNAAPSSRQPGVSGLIPTRTQAVRIVSEDLTIRMVDESGAAPAYFYGFARVVAEYTLLNQTNQPVTLSLVYAGQSAQTFTATLDGRALPTRLAEVNESNLPQEWKLPQQVLNPFGGEYAQTWDLAREPLSFSNFDVTLAANQRAVLRMENDQRIGFDKRHPVNVTRHFVYVLAPARNWAGLDRLNIRVIVPRDYQFSSEPRLLEQSRDARTVTYAASFNGVPADALRVAMISTQTLWTGSPTAVTVIPGAIAGFLCGIAGFMLGHMFVRNRKAFGWESTLSGCLGIFIAAFLALASGVIVSLIASRLYDHPDFVGGYTLGFALFAAVLLGVALAIFVSFIGGVVFLARRSMAKT